MSNLHRSGNVPDWEMIEPSERNIFQKIAARTNGYVTPGNFFTVLGVALVAHGAYAYTQGNQAEAAIEIGAGFACDAVDGWAADKSGTKSPFGKVLDASADKAKIVAALVSLSAGEAVTLATVGAVGAQNVANTIFTVIADRKGVEMQPEEDGKKTMVAQCMGLGMAALGHAYVSGGDIATATQIVGNGVAITGSFYPGLKATASYYRSAFVDSTEVVVLPSTELGFETEQ